MTIKRLLIVQAMLALGLGSIYLLPKSSKHSPAGIALELPDRVGEWIGKDVEISERELSILSKDTSFARKVYSNAFGDQILVSIVLSGYDMVNSIHRPERCLPAQGWDILSKDRAALFISDRPDPLKVTRLHCGRTVELQDHRKIPLKNLNYYWFKGYTDETPDHIERSIIDIRDRVLYGYNQRWAYVTIAATITDNVMKNGRSEKETAKIIESFIAEIVPYFQRPPEDSSLAGR